MANINVDITTTLLGDTDTPNSYVGEGGKFLAVKADESGTEFKSVSSDLTIDTTPITGGATGYPLYHKSGNVVGEFTGAYFDTVNNRVGIGTTTPAGILHVKGAGNLATDVVAQFNSANGTSGVFKVNGDGSFTIGSSGSNGINGYWGAGLYAVSIANLLFAVPDLNKVDVASGKRLEFNTGAYISTPGNGTIKISSVSGGALSNGMWLHPYSGSMSFGADHVQDGTHQATFYNGTAPSTAISTAFKMFSASGQPKFLLGYNDVIKLYKQPTPTTLSDVITLLTNLGLC